MKITVIGSSHDSTVARLTRLIDKPARGAVQVGRDLLDHPPSITRADAAATLVDLVETGTYARTAVNVAGR
jgi:hypothetical protein